VIEAKYLAYILSLETPENRASAENTKKAAESIEKLKGYLSESNANKSMQAIAVMMQFPMQVLQSQQDFISKSLKDYIQQCSERSYTNLILSLNA